MGSGVRVSVACAYRGYPADSAPFCWPSPLAGRRPWEGRRYGFCLLFRLAFHPLSGYGDRRLTCQCAAVAQW